MNYTVVKTINGSELLVDEGEQVLRVIWDGIVTLETAKSILNKGADYIEDGQCDKIILDRSALKEFETEARIWIKSDLLKNRAKRLVSKVKQLAIIESQSKLGAIFSKMITTAIQLIFPNLKTKKFSNNEEATAWLQGVELVNQL